MTRASKPLTEAVDDRKERDLSRESFKYLFVDGVLFPMRGFDGSMEKVPVFVAMGITEKAG